MKAKSVRQTFIDNRVSELLAAGWQSAALAQKRAAREWRRQSPQHVAAVRRNDAMRAARSERLAALPLCGALAVIE